MALKFGWAKGCITGRDQAANVFDTVCGLLLTREERAVSTLGSNRCNSTLLSHVSYGMGKRSGDDGWGYLEQSPSTACLAGPLVTPQ